MATSSKLAKIIKIRAISAIWIIPIVTAIVGLWIIYSHFADRGTSFTLLAKDASGIVAGKTVIKNRSVDIGIVDEVTLSKDFEKVVIKGRIYNDMEPLLKNDSIFWVVKPEIGRDGVTGLGTILSGVYIELASGNDTHSFKNNPFILSDNPPLSDPSIKGIRVNLESDQNGVIPRGASVMFHGYRVGNVETSEFDIDSRKMKYQIFITKPYDALVTQNVRFWKEGGIDLALSSSGASLNVPSLDVLMSGGISFDLPDGSKLGAPAEQHAVYKLYEDKKSIQDSQYTEYKEFLIMLSESISGLVEGAPVEYHGIRLGTVSKVPFYTSEMLNKTFILNQRVPVLIRIEPDRLSELVDEKIDIATLIMDEQKNGLRASLKTSNMFTGALFIDLDFYPELKNKYNAKSSILYGYNTIETTSTGIAQIQAKVMQLLDNFNNLPLNNTMTEFNKSLASTQRLMNSLNQIMASNEMQNMPGDLQETLRTLNETMKGIQPGSELNKQMNESLQKVQQMMDELTPLLNTLNDKSNALIFSAPNKKDQEPKAKGKK
ncbi:intermembrane transport protein PqiB [Gilliamella sp. B14448G11]|uniref:intermembrane transport protein PqiB n=1 Tax=unclassified Gilliamella TaxID=2685620 RepID=UPI0018DC8F6F|nr:MULTISPECIES: intermembrane transport protein PqiB [unclassified Gilliamella]MBI0027227.1 intermembrane transport protein PqiB [Gilliamella sp. B14448G7]MBI0029757.1 intermembrane transport protein PqiB [Gilliamella sp. B14384G15]MBI0034132.1 intermembrane transport protein PqiB [Gilliamella sp. B14448G11]MBI0041867.1 intermembrane transport protein PqiB [Gilliamella sp. B14448G12]MBI0057536.1 intermembrane transport protein PqiB [Gilliamella sp. B14384G12]